MLEASRSALLDGIPADRADCLPVCLPEEGSVGM